MESQELIIALVTLAGSASAFKFYEYIVRSKKETAR